MNRLSDLALLHNQVLDMALSVSLIECCYPTGFRSGRSGQSGQIPTSSRIYTVAFTFLHFFYNASVEICYDCYDGGGTQTGEGARPLRPEPQQPTGQGLIMKHPLELVMIHPLELHRRHDIRVIHHAQTVWRHRTHHAHGRWEARATVPWNGSVRQQVHSRIVHVCREPSRPSCLPQLLLASGWPLPGRFESSSSTQSHRQQRR